MHGRTVLVTGASGFVGRVVCDALEQRGWRVRATGYRNTDGAMQSVAIGPGTDWSDIINGCDAVVHLAGRAHVLREVAPDPLAAFREVNTEGTRTLASAAAVAGVQRLVFLSSVAVHKPTAQVLDENQTLGASTPYGLSKLEAEAALRVIAGQTGLEVAVLRAPLVYGPGVGARFLQLLRWCRAGVPMPFGAVRNQRSFIGVRNLADAACLALEHPGAANRSYLVADREVISTPELMRQLARSMGSPARLLPVHASLLRLMARSVGKELELERLIGSLVVSTRLIRDELGWIPPVSLHDGLAETAAWYVA